MFGVLGLFVGPVILSVTAALVMMLHEDIAGKKQAEVVSIATASPVKSQSAGEQ
jgi:predicted PurR-regulated permease PerM